jgi:RHS repeat-associated protein
MNNESILSKLHRLFTVLRALCLIAVILFVQNTLGFASDKVELGSVNFSFGLGLEERGISAGLVKLKSDAITSDLFSPAALEIYLNGEGYLVKTGDEPVQINTYSQTLNFAVVDQYGYTITIYNAKDKQAVENHEGLWSIKPDAVPEAIWTIENPDREIATNRFKITKDIEGSISVYEYEHNVAANTWILRKGSDTQFLQTTTKVEATLPDGLETETDTIVNQINQVNSKTKTTYKNITCDTRTQRLEIEKIVDPDGAALTTATEYYELPSCPDGSCGRIKQKIYPDGSWIRYEYDTESRTTKEIRSYLDAPVTASESVAKVTTYDYTVIPGSNDSAENIYLPRTIVETTNNQVVSKTFIAYITNTTENHETEIKEICTDLSAGFGDPSNLRTTTITKLFNLDTIDLPDAGKILKQIMPDNTQNTYTYEFGAYEPGVSSPGVFTTGDGEDVKVTKTQGTVTNPEGIANKTTRQIKISDHVAKVLLEEFEVYTGSAYERINWTAKTYDDQGHLIETASSDNTKTESHWSCCGKDYEKDIQGIEYHYTNDALGRRTSELKTINSNDITTTYTLDALGRRTNTQISSLDLTLTSSKQYDLAGRITQIIDPSNLTTTFSYPDPRTTIETKPGGATIITSTFVDGKIKSITGTGVVDQYYDYGVNADGSQWSTISKALVTSPNYEKTTIDCLGRIVSVGKPGFEGTETIQYFYNALGQIEKIEQPDKADILYTYDALGNPTLAGLDIDNNGTLDPASIDRIVETNIVFDKPAADWFQTKTEQVYAIDNDATSVTSKVEQKRLTGFTANLVNETITTDQYGNQTISQTTLDRATKTLTKTIDSPDSTNDETSITVEGLLTSLTSKTGVTTTYDYDNLGRRTGETDPRTGTTTIHYNALNQVDYVDDPLLNRTRYEYDPDTGLNITKYNAKDKSSFYEYNDLGKLTKIWGEEPLPVQYTYDAYGRLSELYTYQQGSDWTSPSWPSSTGTPSVTTWNYQDSTDLLLSKEYPDGKNTLYTYQSGKLHTRTWARTGSVITTYNYDPNTAQLLNIDYSDLTPDVTATYDRLGRLKTIQDYLGTRTFAYNNLALESETLSGLINSTITRTYDAQYRDTGFNLNSEYNVTYAYETTGRFNNLAYTIGTNTNSVGYTYVPDSDLLQSKTLNSQPFVTYGYEANRNLKTQVKNQFNTIDISQYDYIYNELAQRTNVDKTGTIFDPAPTLTPETKTYTPNILNQYTNITPEAPEPETILNYDDDGNLTEKVTGSSGQAYTYNAENRLITIEPLTPAAQDKKTEFAYDYMGRRVQKKVYEYESSVWVLKKDSFFIYDNWNLIKEITTQDAVTSSDYYVWGLDLSQTIDDAGGIGGLVANITATDNYFYTYDANGNVGQVIDIADGSIKAAYEYDPFGNIIKQSGDMADANKFRFSTKYFDTETSLYYYGYRYYDSDSGRWLNRDPLGEEGGLNLYGFVLNDPVDKVDPLGLLKWRGWSMQVSTVVLVGATFVRYELESECVNGRKAKIVVWAVGPSAGIGVKATATWSSINFDDYANEINIDNFNGVLMGVSAGVTAHPGVPIKPPGSSILPGTGPGVGLGASYVRLGNAFSDITDNPGVVAGYDRSVTGTVGSSTVVESKIVDCCDTK